MDFIEFLQYFGGWIAAVIVGIILYFVNGKRINMKNLSETLQERIDEVIAFFNPEAAMAETSLETVEMIPATCYQMTEESCNRVLDTCASEEEKARIIELIAQYENPVAYGEECCIYTIETTGAIYEVKYGVPELLLDKTKV